MSACLDTLLADQRRIDDRAAPVAKPVKLTRADHIKATGEARRRAYRTLNPDADTAMIYGSQIGYLHGEIVRLDNELQGYAITRDPALDYLEVCCDELNADVWVGFNYEPGSAPRITSARYFEQTGDPGDPGEDDTLEVMEVWVNGIDIAAVILERVAEQISDSVRNKIANNIEAAQEYA